MLVVEQHVARDQANAIFDKAGWLIVHRVRHIVCDIDYQRHSRGYICIAVDHPHREDLLALVIGAM
ncbi:hypothetical protein D3C81_1855080 [compost metagenome]